METKKYIVKFKEIHKSKYEYLIKESDILNTKKIKIKCPIHGVFKQLVCNHLKGAGCKECGYIEKGLKSRNTQEWFIQKFKEIHDEKYDYSKVKYTLNHEKIEIICSKHGSFFQTPTSHFYAKAGCKKCYSEEQSKNLRLNSNELVNKIDKDILESYPFDASSYKKMGSKIRVKCKIHNLDYEQIAQSYFKGCIGCPKCVTSLGEIKIRNFLDINKIKYIAQKKFEDCKYKRQLSFDFYLPDLDLCIEFDGQQHYKKVIRKRQESLKIIQKRDKIKNQYCEINKIKLIRIPYWDSQNIDSILKLSIELLNIY